MDLFTRNAAPSKALAACAARARVRQGRRFGPEGQRGNRRTKNIKSLIESKSINLGAQPRAALQRIAQFLVDRPLGQFFVYCTERGIWVSQPASLKAQLYFGRIPLKKNPIFEVFENIGTTEEIEI